MGQASTSAADSMALAVVDSSIPGRRDLQKTRENKDKSSKSDDRPYSKKKKNKKVPSGPKGPQVYDLTVLQFNIFMITVQVKTFRAHNFRVMMVNILYLDINISRCIS